MRTILLQVQCPASRSGRSFGWRWILLVPIKQLANCAMLYCGRREIPSWSLRAVVLYSGAWDMITPIVTSIIINNGFKICRGFWLVSNWTARGKWGNESGAHLSSSPRASLNSVEILHMEKLTCCLQGYVYTSAEGATFFLFRICVVSSTMGPWSMTKSLGATVL